MPSDKNSRHAYSHSQSYRHACFRQAGLILYGTTGYRITEYAPRSPIKLNNPVEFFSGKRRSYVFPCTLQRSEKHTSELQSRQYLVCRLLLEKNKDQFTATCSVSGSRQ